jgi:hypothetical protein
MTPLNTNATATNPTQPFMVHPSLVKGLAVTCHTLLVVNNISLENKVVKGKQG